MAALGTTLMSKVMGHSEAEKAFRPWWDVLEDFMIYALVMLGLIVIPTAMIMGTPLDCNFCQNDHCGENYTNTETNPEFNAWWVKKFCTLNGSVQHFMLYFPYILLMVALILILVERFFVKVFKSGMQMEKFYRLLLQEHILSKPDDGKTVEWGGDFTDGGREAVEVRQSFKKGNNYFVSYLLRTILELFLALALMAWMIIK